jgi:hypothetical protein
MALNDADLERARQLAAAAPAPGPQLLARLRAILSGFVLAQSVPDPATEPQAAQGGTADAA